MGELKDVTASLGEAYAKFAAIVESIRPELHRYCSRMTGSALDGEDLVQETLAQACYRLGLLREEVPLRPWLFTIAHHKCVDFLRKKSASPTVEIDERNEPTVEIADDIEDRDLASHAFSRFVSTLPERERAAIILKEVLGYSLPEIAAILETSVGGVKSALHRGREKLDIAKDAPEAPSDALPPAAMGYIEAFNERDWARLQTLLEAEVSCQLVGFAELAGRDAVGGSYVTNYARLSYQWKLVAGSVDGEPVIVCMRQVDGHWKARHAVRLDWRDGRVTRIRDYAHVPYLLVDARIAMGVALDSEDLEPQSNA